jgi:hypothetical protein
MSNLTNTRPKSAVIALTVLALALVLGITAFAVSWPSFQNKSDNNGVIDPVAPPPTVTPTVTSISLSSSAATAGGIDSTSVIDSGYAYTLYNGGGIGACLAITNLTTPVTPAPFIVIDPAAVDIQQLSTPYLDTTSHTLYVLTSHKAEWVLWSVNVTNPTNPGPSVQLATGDGQANTPISAATDVSPAYIYFGSYSGARTGSYYQYGITAAPGTLTTFTPPRGDDFYLAGAAFANIPGEGLGDCVVFGGDRATIYVRPVSAFASGTGNAVTLVDLVNSPGPVRSSIVKNGNFVYFTSGGSWNAILWQILVTDLDNSATINDVNNYNMKAHTSTSTPVISANGYIYVGSYNNDGTGLVEAYTPGDGINTPPALAAVIYNPGDAVHSSPIVYSVTAPVIQRADYVYFTTYADHSQDPPPATNHNGYCYRVGLTNLSSPVPSLAWNLPNPAGVTGSFALQGFASDNGYLVYGDDSNTLYIFHS